MDNNKKNNDGVQTQAVNLDSQKLMNADVPQEECDVVFVFDNNNTVIDPKISALASGGCCIKP